MWYIWAVASTATLIRTPIQPAASSAFQDPCAAGVTVGGFAYPLVTAGVTGRPVLRVGGSVEERVEFFGELPEPLVGLILQLVGPCWLGVGDRSVLGFASG